MEVREATIQDKSKWDSFVDDNDGNFTSYYDWKIINEIADNKKTKRIPLVIQTDQVIGICHLTKKNKVFYSRLETFGNSGVLFKKGMSDEEKSSATSALMKYISQNLASKCSSLIVREESIATSQKDGECSRVLLSQGFRVRRPGMPGLPCSHILTMKPPFEETIWKGLWTYNLKHTLKKVLSRGVVVIQDPEYQYLDTFLDMKEANYKRHGIAWINRKQIKAEIEIFKDKTRLFVALENNQPIFGMMCHYTRSVCALWEGGSFTKSTNNVNKLCHKVIIEDACNSGYKYAHFGSSDTEGLAALKDAYGAVRMPIVEYEKTYSPVRKMIERFYYIGELSQFILNRVARDRKYLWNNRRIILGKLTPRKRVVSS